MSGKTNSSRKTERRQATIEEIVAAAWELASEQGLAGFSLRDLGARVGMRAQSLYTYFSSKSDIYDAMFLDGNRAFLAAMGDLEPLSGDDPAAAMEAARAAGHRFFDFCTADPVRYQLLFQRTIPDFTPSPGSYAVAREAYDRGVAAFAGIGATPADVDLWTAVVTGLVSQQIANDPGGDRWRQLVDRAADMVVAEVAPELFEKDPNKENVMTIMQTGEVDNIAPIDHREAMALQETELARTIDMLRSLTDEEWTAPTDCPDWDVRAMYLHVLGACEAGASMRENVHQLKAAYAYRRREGGALEAALSSVQVRERVDLDPAQIVDRLADIAPKTVRGRRRTPGPVRRLAKLAIDGPVHETWRLGYLIDVIYLRDMWMHRVDAAVATGRSIDLTSDHDGRIVADVVAEWSRRHGEPFLLELTGPAGGRFSHDADSPGAQRFEVDAVEFCRTLAGRVAGQGLLATIVPF